MSVETEARTAGQIAEDRLMLGARVKALRDELVVADEATRADKLADFQAAIEQFESCEAKYSLQKALENANSMIEKLSQQPNRPSSSGYSKAATVDRHTGQLIDPGDLASLGNKEVLGHGEYNKAFEAFLESRGKLGDVRSRKHRDILERYGKGGERSLATNEIFMPFSKVTTLTAASGTGSNLVSPDFRFDVITQRSVTPIIMKLARVITTDVSTVTFPKNTDANTDSGRVGVIGTNNAPIKGEQPTSNNKDTGAFASLTINAKTGTMYTDVSADMFQDVPGFNAYLNQEVYKLFANRIDKEVFSQTQLSDAPEAILANTDIVSFPSGTAALLGVDSSTIYNNLTNMFFGFRQSYAANLSWVFPRATHGVLYKVKDTTGQPILYNYQTGAFANGPQYSLFGAPTNYAEYMPATGVSAAKSILVGDFSEYLLLMRQGFTVIVDDLSQQSQNNVRVNFKYRIGGAVRDARAFTYLRESVS